MGGLGKAERGCLKRGWGRQRHDGGPAIFFGGIFCVFDLNS